MCKQLHIYLNRYMILFHCNLTVCRSPDAPDEHVYVESCDYTCNWVILAFCLLCLHLQLLRADGETLLRKKKKKRFSIAFYCPPLMIIAGLRVTADS